MTLFPDPPKSREDLWERIRATSKDAVVLDEMIRHGFWPERGTLPQDPAEEVHRKAELQRELAELSKSQLKAKNADKLLREIRAKRLADAKKRREETKARRAKEREDRAKAWSARKEHEAPYLGEGVSGGLHELRSNEELLRQRALPVLHVPEQLALALGISMGQLRFLAYSRKVARVAHYRTFKIPKKTGGERLISAPMPRLKRAQHWILREILDRLDRPEAPSIHANAHGFRREHSIVTNAAPHAGAAVVVNLDLKDFFPSIGWKRVRGVFRSLGYSEAVATVLALICTSSDLDEVSLDGVTYHVATSPRKLPQGAPTSPAITNVLCDRLDRRLTKAAAKLGFVYTRYADDLTFSAKEKDAPVGKLLRQVRWLVNKDGLTVHPDKTRVLRKGRRQEVTGLTVNAKPSVPREALRRFRALLHQIERQGPAGKTWNGNPNVLASIQGFANFVAMVSPEKGASLQARVAAIHAKHGWVPPRRTPRPTPVAGPQPSAPPTASSPPSPPSPEEEPKPKKPWWKIF